MAKPHKKKAPKAAKKSAARKPAKKAKPVAKKRAVAPKKHSPAAKKGANTKHAATPHNAVAITSAMDLIGKNNRPRKLDPFTRGQKEKLLQLRDAMVDSMAGVAQDTLRSRAEGSEASAFGMHQ